MDNKATSPKRSLSRRYGASLTVGLIGLVLSSTAFFAVGKWAAKWRASDFDRLAEARCELFDREVAGSVGKLKALKQFFNASQFVDRHEFATFIGPLHEISTHKLAFFWAPQVLEVNRRSLEKAARAEGISGFAIHSDSPVDGPSAVTQRERYYPVLYYCHVSDWAVGMDLLREPHLRKAIKQAVDTDQPAVTGSVVFPGEQEDWAGVVVFHAVYHKGSPTTTVEERRSAVEGVVVCTMQLGGILKNVIQTLTPVGLNIQVADLSTSESKQILHQHWARLQSGDTGDTLNKMSDASGLIYTTTFDVAGHTWEMRCTPSTGYLAAHPLRTHWIVLIGGLILTALLVVQFYMTGNRTAIVEAIVDERTAQLRASEDSLAQAQALAHVGSWKWEFEDNRVTWSEETYRILGLDPVDCAGNIETICWEAVHPDDKASVFEAQEACVANQEFHPIEYRIIRPDGEIRHVHTASKMLYDSDGMPIGIAGSIQDITDRKQAEEALIESEARYRTLFDGSAQGILVADIETMRFKYANPAMCRILGYTEEEMTRLAVTDIHPKESLEHVISEFEAQARGEKYLAPEIPCLRKNGKIVYTDISTAKVTLAGTECNVGFFTDITNRMQAEEALRESEENYRTLIGNIPNVVWTTDKHGHTTFISDIVTEVYGYTPEEIYQNGERLWLGRIHPDDIDRVMDAFGTLVREGTSFDIEYRIQRKDGRWIWLHDRALKTYNDHGKTRVDGVFSDITERKRAEEALRESEERVRALSDAAFEAIFFSERGICSDQNKTAEEMFGYTSSEAIGRPGTDWIVPADREMVRDNMLSGRKEPYEATALRKDGATFPALIQGRMIDYHGRQIRVTSLRDISVRKRALKGLRESEERFRTIFETAEDSIFIKDRNLRYTMVNPAMERLLGMPVSRVIGKTDSEIFGEEVGVHIREADTRVLTGEILREEHTKPVDEVPFTFNVIKVPMRDNDDNIIGLCGIARDITERKQAEADRIRLSRAIEQADETVVITDAEGTIQYVNPAFEKVTGYSVEEAIGRNPRMLKSGKHDDAFYEKMWKTLLRGEEWRSDIINKKKDGTLFTEGMTISPVFDSEGKIVNYVAAKHDITEILRLRELETRAQRLETAGSIAGQVAHDFNNLLGPLMAYPELIREELPGDHKVLTFLSSIETAAQQMADINQQLLTMGRRGHYNLKSMHMNEVVLQAVKELQPLPETLECETNLAEDLMNILGGPSQIYRAVANILHNARDAMQDIGTITIETENYYADDVTVAYNRVPRGEYIKLTISDTGAGIPDDIVEKIFDPFFTSKATDKKRGSGLGMSVVDAVIKDHKGYIDLRTKVGRGTSFYLYFPVTRETIEVQDTDQIIGGSETVLVVDDDYLQRDIVRSLLQKLGYEVSVVESGEKAIEFLRDNPQDLLILDMIMPHGMDGADTYTKVVEIYPDQKAIIVSGYSESEDIQRAQSLGAGAFIKKPITFKKIAGAVRKELDSEMGVGV